MTVVGDAWVDIQPNFAGFKEKVTSGVTSAIKDAQLEAQGAIDDLTRAETGLATAQERQARAAAAAADAEAGLIAAQRESAAAAAALAEAQDGDAAAVSRNAEAQARLEGAQAKVNATALGAAGAQRGVTSAENEVAGASDRAAESHGRAGGALQAMANVGGPLLLGLVGGAAAVGYESIKMAANFEEATTQLVTGAGEDEKALGQVRQGILDMAGQVGQTPIDLAKGLFLIESAGYHGAEGLTVLKDAAEGAKVGNSDLATTGNAVTTVMKDYHLGAGQAADATNFLVGVVSLGKTHMDDLASSMQAVLPIASSLNVPLEQVGGAMASLTARGVPADRAATALRFTMGALANETPKGATALEEIGLSSKKVGDELTHGGLLPTFQDIEDHLSKKFPAGSAEYNAALANITGGQRGLTAALGLTGQNMQQFTSDTQTVTDKIQGAHGQILGWNTAQGDLNTKLDQAKGSAESLGIEIGNKLIPVATDLLGWAKDTVTWFDHNREAAMALGAALGAVATVFIGAYMITKLGELVSHLSTAAEFVGRFVERLAFGPVAQGAGLALDGLSAQAGAAATGIDAAGARAEAGGAEFAGAGATAATGAGGFEAEAGAATASATEIDLAGGRAAAGGAAFEGLGARAAGAAPFIAGAGEASAVTAGSILSVGLALGAVIPGLIALAANNDTQKLGVDQLRVSYNDLTGNIVANTAANKQYTDIIKAGASEDEARIAALRTQNAQVGVNTAGDRAYQSVISQGGTIAQASAAADRARATAQQGATDATNRAVDAARAAHFTFADLQQVTALSAQQLAGFAQVAGVTDSTLKSEQGPTILKGKIQDIALGVIPAQGAVQSLAILTENAMNHMAGVTATAGQQINQSVSHNFSQIAATVGSNMNIAQTTTQQGSSAMLQIWTSMGNQQLANTSSWTRQMNDDFGNAMRVAALEFQTGGQTSVDDLSTQLNIGKDDVNRILSEFDLRFGKTADSAAASGGATGSRFGDEAHKALADKYGPFSTQVAAYEIALNSGLGPIAASIAATDPNSPIPSIPIINKLAAGGPVDKATLFIAGEAGGETVISHDPAHRAANVGYWAQAGKKLGIRGFQEGGFTDPSSVPKPPALTPEFGIVPMSFGVQGQGLLDHEYNAAVKVAAKRAAAAAAAVSSGGGDPFGGGPIKAYMLAEVAKRWPGVEEAAAFDYLEMREAGYDPNAANPTSQARGLAQNISGWGPGYEPGNVQQQTAWMLNYIAGRYGDPLGAAAHERSAGWYDLGGIIPPGFHHIANMTGRDELVLPPGAGQTLGAAGAMVNIVRNLVIQGDVRDVPTLEAIQAMIDQDNAEIERELGNWGIRQAPAPGAH